MSIDKLSFSAINLLLSNCNYRYKLAYIDKYTALETDEMRVGKEKAKEAQEVLEKEGYLIEYAVENEFLWGVIDAIKFNNNEAEIIELKLKNITEQAIMQVKIYAALVFENNKNIEKINVKLKSLLTDYEKHLTFDRSIVKILESIKKIYDALQNNKIKFTPRPGANCMDCLYSYCCDAIKDRAIIKISDVKGEITTEKVKKLCEIIMFYESKLKQAKEFIKKYVEEHGNVETDDFIAEFREYEKINIEINDIIKMLKENALKYLKVDTEKLKKDKIEIPPEFIKKIKRFGIYKKGGVYD